MGQEMEESSSSSSDQFPGFQTCAHKDEFEYRRSVSPRLRNRAPCPLQLKPNVSLSQWMTASRTASNGLSSSSSSSSSASATSSYASLCQSKDPIPLLSPLVLPSLLESSYIQKENTAKLR